MPGFAPLFGDTATNVPVNTNPLVSRIARNALNVVAIGAAAGATATGTKARVKNGVDNAGKAVIETQTDINRATTAADITQMKTTYTKKRPSFIYVKDLSGNGGAAFTRS